MFPEFAYKFHAYELARAELLTQRNDLKNKVQMKYILLHLYIFSLVVLNFIFYEKLSVLMMLSPFAILLISIAVFESSFSGTVAVIRNAIMYPYYSLLLNSVETDLIRVEKKLYRFYENQIGRGSIRYITPKIPSYSDVISSHYCEKIMSNYLNNLYKENNHHIDLNHYLNTIAKENEVAVMSKELSVSLVKPHKRT